MDLLVLSVRKIKVKDDKKLALQDKNNTEDPPMVILRADPEFLDFLRTGVTMYEKQPHWKKGWLEASSKAFNDVPRIPVE